MTWKHDLNNFSVERGFHIQAVTHDVRHHWDAGCLASCAEQFLNLQFFAVGCEKWCPRLEQPSSEPVLLHFQVVSASSIFDSTDGRAHCSHLGHLFLKAVSCVDGISITYEEVLFCFQVTFSLLLTMTGTTAPSLWEMSSQITSRQMMYQVQLAIFLRSCAWYLANLPKFALAVAVLKSVLVKTLLYQKQLEKSLNSTVLKSFLSRPTLWLMTSRKQKARHQQPHQRWRNRDFCGDFTWCTSSMVLLWFVCTGLWHLYGLGFSTMLPSG